MIDQTILNEFSFYLKKNKYRNKIQELILIDCTNNGFIIINLIKIKKSQRCKGYGSLVMYDICQFADSHNVQIKLWATNEYGSDLKRLYEFYKRHGFLLNKNSNIGEMTRDVKNMK